jgi:hypothetical protein
MFRQGYYYGPKLKGPSQQILPAMQPVVKLLADSPLVRDFSIRFINGRATSGNTEYRIQKVKAGIRVYANDERGGQFVTIGCQHEAAVLDLLRKSFRCRMRGMEEGGC